MEPLLDAIRSVLGTPSFYTNGSLDYGLVFEYFVGALILCLVVSSVFRFLITLVKR